MTERLSPDDVAKLLEDPSADNRTTAARKVSEQFSDELSDSEREIAEDIFRIMVQDAEVRVRKALSESLKNNPDVPRDVATTLARDVEEVALPVIEFSSVLSNDDLIEIVRTKGSDHQKAVANRPEVSAEVADVLVDTHDEDVVATLMGNDGAEIRDETFDKVLTEYKDSDKVKTPMVHRSNLPLAVSERLVNLVSERLKQELISRHELSPGTVTDILMESREQATVSLLDPNAKRLDVLDLVDQMHANGRLTPTVAVRALCMGDLTFFEAAVAKRAGIPVANAYTLVHDRGDLGLRRLFEAAEMPENLIRIARTALVVAEEMNLTAGDDRETFRNVMIERVLTQHEEDFDGDPDNFDYLIGKLGRAEKKAA